MEKEKSHNVASSETVETKQAEDRHEIGFLHAYFRMWKNSFVFNGQTSRSEFLKAKVVDWGLFIALYAAVILFGDSYKHRELDDILAVILCVYWVGTFIPNLSIVVRRFHDLKRSGWWAIAFPVAILYVGVIGSIKNILRTNGVILGAIPNILLMFPVFLAMPAILSLFKKGEK